MERARRRRRLETVKMERTATIVELDVASVHRGSGSVARDAEGEDRIYRLVLVWTTCSSSSVKVTGLHSGIPGSERLLLAVVVLSLHVGPPPNEHRASQFEEWFAASLFP